MYSEKRCKKVFEARRLCALQGLWRILTTETNPSSWNRFINLSRWKEIMLRNDYSIVRPDKLLFQNFRDWMLKFLCHFSLLVKVSKLEKTQPVLTINILKISVKTYRPRRSLYSKIKEKLTKLRDFLCCSKWFRQSFWALLTKFYMVLNFSPCIEQINYINTMYISSNVILFEDLLIRYSCSPTCTLRIKETQWTNHCCHTKSWCTKFHNYNYCIYFIKLLYTTKMYHTDTTYFLDL